MRYCVTKVAVPKKNNEALNGKDLMIERKEQGRKVNKKNIKNGRNFLYKKKQQAPDDFLN